MKILFLCNANQCRSPLAESVLRSMLLERGLADVEVESAGLHDYGGTRDITMASYAHKAGYDMGGNPRRVTKAIVDSADLVICMDFFQFVEIQRLYLPYARWNRLHRFNEICFGEQTDLIDPTGDTDFIYRHVFQTIQQGCSNLALKISKHLREGESLF